MSFELTLLLFGAAVIAFALISRWSQQGPMTAPLFFTLAGLLLSDRGLGLLVADPEWSLAHWLAEVTLVWVLFTDASRINLRQLREGHNIPLRLLGLGLPLCIGVGALVAYPMFPELGWAGAFTLAVILAPTDAALGQAVINNERVPVRIRQAFNVESGLNDGMALPLLIIGLSWLIGENHSASHWLELASMQLLLGPIYGVAVGLAAGRALDAGVQRRWVSPTYQRLGLLAVAMSSYGLAELCGGNGFIAAFCAGAAVGTRTHVFCAPLHRFAETEGQLLSLINFLLFGAIMIPHALPDLTWTHFFYALLSLTVIRIIPVIISLTGTRLQFTSKLFLGWFGPRGLASLLYVLLVMQQDHAPGKDQLFSVAVLTILLSVLLHGVTAAPLAQRYSRYIQRNSADTGAEQMETSSFPTRRPFGREEA
ncbi:sodium:proton antiporter [Hahella aquimaris]|uniref:cation:proton antiporter n=1 Tax=Hahella sp. HNIBRBA332 TaxID=3015983 RepID=UPI00273B3F25|nr:sodium:proton antiporter [Hahella sp. HNIBRBA332]WLQ12101.1 sodium:proton antiporter [Hahella sp. HNIBRBA332]